MKSIILIGAGNVATHLGITLKEKKYNIKQVYSRNINNAIKLAEIVHANATDQLSNIKDADLVIISINDNAVKNILKKIKAKNIVHTSGALDLNIFNNKFDNYGVMYPLQTFNKKKSVNFSQIPICIEANSITFEKKLLEISKKMSKNVIKINSHERRILHVAAVFACNFTHHMFTIADQLLTKTNSDISILLPLVNQTLTQLDSKNIKHLQTGPAVRNEKETINKHIELIEDKDLKIIYKKISDHIIKTYA